MQPTGKRFLLALDVSGSMCSPVLGSTAITAREASAAMAMVTARTEANYSMVGFSNKLVPLNNKITAKMNLNEVVSTISKVRWHYSHIPYLLFVCGVRVHACACVSVCVCVCV